MLPLPATAFSISRLLFRAARPWLTIRFRMSVVLYAVLLSEFPHITDARMTGNDADGLTRWFDEMAVEMHAWRRGAVVVRKPKEITKIRPMDLQFSAKIDMMEIVYLIIYIYNFIAYLRLLQS